MLTKEKLVDIRENSIDAEVLAILLNDRSTGRNILWCTDDYASMGEGYGFHDTIEVHRISGESDGVIKPRIEKGKAAQELRSREKAEVFTPSWVCNVQNNLVDDAWFGISRRRFNTEIQEGWKTNYYPISFAETKGKTWKDYVRATRMEVSCGEAPYLTTRYDTVTGKYIPVRCRVGLLDRKLRVIHENVTNSNEWIEWALIGVQNIYGYDWQGDNVLLARENILYSVIESFHDAFDVMLDKETIKQFAEIISWNIWQMDGIKFVVPDSCQPILEEQMTLFDLKELPEGVAKRLFEITYNFDVIPGTDWNGNFHSEVFDDWISKVKAWALENDRLEVSMQIIGNGLSYAKFDEKNTLVPSIMIALNARDNDDLRKGYRLGVLNQRGVHWLDPEGKEERELASKFESRANSIEELGYSRFADTLRSISAQYMREAEYNSKHELDDE